jgi:hypothetical protein
VPTRKQDACDKSQAAMALTGQRSPKVAIGILLAIRAAELIFEIVNRDYKDCKCVNAQTKTGA